MASTTGFDEPPAEDILQIIKGIPFSAWFDKKIIEDICDFVPGDGDVLIATYPKTGTTWTQYIVHQILTKGESFPEFNELLEKLQPFLEMSGVAAVDKLTTRPRVYKHHLPYNMVAKNPKAKVIYVYRKPEDTLVSYYHFMKNLNVSYNFDEYFECFVTGKVSYGRYFEHVLSYLKQKDDGNMLMVSYEKLQKNRREEILRIARFLGEEYYDTLINDESILNKVIEHTEFDYMKKNLTLLMPQKPKKAFATENSKEEGEEEAPKVEVTFFRKGVIGDGKKTMNEDQLRRLRELTKEVMKDTCVLKEWLQE